LFEPEGGCLGADQDRARLFNGPIGMHAALFPRKAFDPAPDLRSFATGRKEPAH
jgi:hypothetical protein